MRKSLLVAIGLFILAFTVVAGHAAPAPAALSDVPKGTQAALGTEIPPLLKAMRAGSPVAAQRIAALEALLKEKYGIALETDIAAARVYVAGLEKVAVGEFPTSLAALSGKFNREAIEKAILKADPKAKPVLAGKIPIFAVTPDVGFAVSDDKTLWFGQSKALEAHLAAGQVSGETLPGLDALVGSRAFAILVVPEAARAMIALQAAKDPAAKVYATLRTVKAAVAAGTVRVTLEHASPEAAAEAAKALEASLQDSKKQLAADQARLKSPEAQKGTNREWAASLQNGFKFSEAFLNGAKISSQGALSVVETPLNETAAFLVPTVIAYLFPSSALAVSEGPEAACRTNMRLLEAAAELAEIETKEPPKKVEIKALIKGEYLKEEPRCPESGQYTMTPGGASGIEVVCSKHGKLPASDGPTAKEGPSTEEPGRRAN